MRVEYEIKGKLAEVLQVLLEIEAETGMKPEVVTLDDGRRVRFKHGDFRNLIKGDINEEEYIRRNLIEQGVECDAYRLIKQWYRNPEENEAYLFQMPIDIVNELKAAHKINDSMNGVDDAAIGQALRALGYERIGKKAAGMGTRYGYKVVQLY